MFLPPLIVRKTAQVYKEKSGTHLNLPNSQKVWVGTLAVETKALNGIKRVPQWSHIGSTVV